MTPSSTEGLIRELARSLEPVTPRPSLVASFAIVAGLVLVEVAYIAFAFGFNPHFKAMFIDGWFGIAFIGLVVASICGAIAGLSSAEPGRERLRNATAIAAGAALSATVLACGFGILRLGVGYGVAPTADWSCFTHTIGFALLPVAGFTWLMMRGWVGQPLVGAALGLVGTGAMAALVSELACAAWGPRHLLLGHAGVPLLVAALGTIPVALLLRWRAH